MFNIKYFKYLNVHWKHNTNLEQGCSSDLLASFSKDFQAADLAATSSRSASQRWTSTWWHPASEEVVRTFQLIPIPSALSVVVVVVVADDGETFDDVAVDCWKSPTCGDDLQWALNRHHGVHHEGQASLEYCGLRNLLDLRSQRRSGHRRDLRPSFINFFTIEKFQLFSPFDSSSNE